MGHPYQLELDFTDTYRQHLQEHPALREAACLRVLYPALFEDLRPGDLFAGRLLHYPHICFGLEEASGGPGYACYEDRFHADMENKHLSPEELAPVEAMLALWKTEATITGRLVGSLPADLLQATHNPIGSMFGRLSGACINFGTLLKLGLPGLYREIDTYRAETLRQGRDVSLYDGFRSALDLLVETCHDYARRARLAASRGDGDPAWRSELETIATVLEKITVAPPETLREAIQLTWLYALISGVVNYGRMDIYLGDFYVRDIDAGRITETQALATLQSLWKLVADRKIVFNGRIVIGGMGRSNEKNADRFALAAMEASRTVIETEPQLTLRYYKAMNPALMTKALDVIGAGRVYPMLYNDDVNVPAVQNAFRVSREEAEHYFPYGCGEYALEGISFGSPNCSLSMLKALDVALHNGRDAMTGKPLGLPTGEFGSFKTYDELFAAYQRQVEHFVKFLADRHALEYKAERESAAFLFISMLFDGCVEKGLSVVEHGPRYLGGIIETFGMVNAADSLTAIRKLVYEDRKLTPDELLAALDADFVGHEAIYHLIQEAPKYGNDDDAADRTLQAVSDHVSQFTFQQADRVGLDYYLIVNINNYGNVYMGKECGASADGRRAGTPLANGNTPTAGNDRKGITAFLNSIAKVSPAHHAGYVHNMKFTRPWFTEDRPKLEALLDTYSACGGTQAMITVVSRGDLEAALREPDKYRNLIVRVGGFSARYVELAPEVQMDILNRTLY